MLSYVDEHKMRVYMSCERRYPMGDDYIHFTNNVDYAIHETTANLKGVDMKSVEHLIAFSHWTFQVRIILKFINGLFLQFHLREE